jgi:hypothetical protein
LNSSHCSSISWLCVYVESGPMTYKDRDLSNNYYCVDISQQRTCKPGKWEMYHSSYLCISFIILSPKNHFKT